MKLRILTFVTAITFLAALALPTQCLAQQKLPHYTVIDLGTLGGSYSFAPDDAPNQSGQVDGLSTLPGDAVWHAFLWSDGRMIDLKTLGGPNSAAEWPLNDWGAVGGFSDTSTPNPYGYDYCSFGTYLICRAFVWYDGVMTLMPTLGGNNNGGTQINNWGQMVGDSEIDLLDQSCSPPWLSDRPAMYEQGRVRELPILPGDSWGVAFIINDQGQAAGYSATNCYAAWVSGIWHPVLWENGAAIYLGTLGGQLYNLPQAINNKMQVVGASDLPGDTANQAFLWQQRTGMIDLGTLPGYPNSIAEGINDGGQVVGGASQYPFLGGNCTAFLWQDGVMTDMNTLIPPGSPLYLCFASGINSRGEIAGTAVQVSSGDVHAFLATPSKCEGDCADAATAAIQRPKIALPDNVRNLLLRRARLGGFKGGLVTPQ